MSDIPEAVAAVRRPPERAQADFRVLLDALARPGTIGRLRTQSPAPAATIPTAGLADLEVPLAILTSAPEGPADAADADPAERALRLVTAAPEADASAARLVLALRPITPREVGRLRTGDPYAPELGTRLVQAVSTLRRVPEEESGAAGAPPEPLGPDSSEPDLAEPDSAESDEVRLRLRGPGVPGERRIAVRGLDRAVFAALTATNAGFPAGVDTFLVADDGAVVGLPRTTRIDLEPTDTEGN